MLRFAFDLIGFTLGFVSAYYFSTKFIVAYMKGEITFEINTKLF